MLYLHFSYEEECPDYSHFLIALGVLNALWIWISLAGISSINSRIQTKVKKFLWGLIFILFSRIIFYGVMQNTMSNINSEDIPIIEKWYCDAIYQGGLYVITAILEAILIVVILILTNSIASYIKRN